MKILILSPYSPYPPNSGGRIRQWEQIKYFGQRHDLTVVYTAFTEEEYEMQKSIEPYCYRAVAVKHPKQFSSSDHADLQKLPWPVRTFRTNEMLKTLEELRSVNFDAVIIEFIFMTIYHDLFPVCSILLEHNIESSIFKQYAELPNIAEEKIFGVKKDRAFWKATWMLMAEYENRMWPKFPLRATVSAKDKQEMDSRCPYGRTIVIENGVNTQTVDLVTNGNSRKILFMGTMDYYPNTNAASFLIKSIMPSIWRKDPGISLCIAGLHPPKSIMALASDPRVEVIANPENMREVARRCCLTVVPLRLGGGTRIKILDSLAMGLPVVSTSLGCEGLSVKDGCHILIRDDPEQFADAVLQVISDPLLADNLRRDGRRLVEERYDWGLIFRQLEQELLQLVEKTREHRLKGSGK
jgi:glycosyltransferase involved in cell wall biosynthesis